MWLTPCEAPTCEMRPGHNTRNYVPSSFQEVYGSLTSPAIHVTLIMQEVGPTICSPYNSRILEHLNHLQV